jgi:adenine-specific DNA-methyltransferase
MANLFIPFEKPYSDPDHTGMDLSQLVRDAQRGMPLYDMRTLEAAGNEKSGNYLIHGECLSACAWLKNTGRQVDLVYIDPPFASGSHQHSRVYLRGKPRVSESFEETTYGDKWDQSQYLRWMAANLMAIRSIMSDRASIYIHLDWHISHYVKVLMDMIFGEANFINEIVWSYKSGGASLNSFARKHDTLYLYAKNKGSHVFNPLREKSYNRELKPYRFKNVTEYQDEKGWYTLVNMRDVWEIDMVGRTSGERVDYATQKPEALLGRIVRASSDEGMTVADFFGGSGVTAAVAQKTGRHFIHCDVGAASIHTARDRLMDLGASFESLVIEDGLSLFRNPIQTMGRIQETIPSFHKTASDPWTGTFDDDGQARVPLLLPNLMEGRSRILDAVQMEELATRLGRRGGKRPPKIVVGYIDILDPQGLKEAVAKIEAAGTRIRLMDLKPMLKQISTRRDEARFDVIALGGITRLRLTSYSSPEIQASIDDYNKKKKKTNAAYEPIAVSKAGLELVELVSLDCEQDGGIWHSTTQIKIDKWGSVHQNGRLTAGPWDGVILCEKNPLRVMIRNICGDEMIWRVQGDQCIPQE